MSERKAFYRKIAYAVAIVVLLFPLYVLSSPATVKSSGGWLAKLRTEHDLSQADLGEIDPASETIKLATLGLRGVAVNLLWNKANEYKKKEDWTNLMAVLEQLSKLQPNFIAFWKFQAWNVSYNVSVEFDDYRDRYYYVRRGIEFLQKGIQYNETNLYIPELLWDIGWFVGQKIGRADEHVQYRELFRRDDDYHGDRPLAERDNWLRSEVWYDRAIDEVDNKDKQLGRKSQIVFYQSPASARINYAEAIEEEGVHGSRAEQAWRRAEERFIEFGDHPIDHSTGVVLRLNDYERLQETADNLTAELENLSPGLKERMIVERTETLTPAQKEALEVPDANKTADQYRHASDAQDILRITPQQLAERIAQTSPEKGKQARELAVRIDLVGTEAHFTRNYRMTANYDYWKTRTEFEQTADALQARENTYKANEAYEDGDLIQARSLYREGLASWKRVLDRYPAILESSVMGDDLLGQIKAYRDVLDQLGESLPDDFPLWEIIERYDSGDFRQELAAHQATEGSVESPNGSDSATPQDDAVNPPESDAEGNVVPASDGQPPEPRIE